MRGRLHERTRRVDEREWHPWFAWRPARATSEDSDDKHYASWRWVWREQLERRLRGTPFIGFYWEYRFPQEGKP